MSKVGILPVPAGETSEFDDGFSELQVRILVVYIVTSVLATVGLILRFYTGACLNQRRLGLDACMSAISFQVPNNASVYVYTLSTSLGSHLRMMSIK